MPQLQLHVLRLQQRLRSTQSLNQNRSRTRIVEENRQKKPP